MVIKNSKFKQPEKKYFHRFLQFCYNTLKQIDVVFYENVYIYVKKTQKPTIKKKFKIQLITLQALSHISFAN